MAKKSKPESKGVEERRTGAFREIIESVVIAFVLAFLFRTFEAEAFVIPTGSMASTLMGVHKDVECASCGYQYQVGASQEEDAAEAMAREGHRMTRQEQNQFWNRILVSTGVCPNCRFPTPLRPPAGAEPQDGELPISVEPTYQGDRILVSKFAYQFADPQRWDVIVFRYPNQSWTNYIKRLVGLPGETLDVRDGDIFVKKPGEDKYTIARKPTDKLMAMARIVHDTEYTPLYTQGEGADSPGKSIYSLGWPTPWQAAPDWLSLVDSNVSNLMANWDSSIDPTGQFAVSDDYKSYSTDGSSPQTAWLRYRQFEPSEFDWDVMVGEQKLPPAGRIEPSLISDFLAYNEGKPNQYVDQDGALGANLMPPQEWVGDLILEATVDVEGPSGEIVFEAVKSGYFFRCTIDVATGEAVMSMEASTQSRKQPGPIMFDAAQGAEPQAIAKGQTPIKGAGRFQVRFANVDQELRLWVGEDGSWSEPEEIVFDGPTTYDRLPVGAEKETGADYAPMGIGSRGVPLTVSQLRLWRDIYYTDPPRNSAAEYVHDIEIPEGKLFAMGDNSGRSKDSRYFGFVDVENELIGKALYVYWPHAWNVVWPNFERMKFVH